VRLVEVGCDCGSNDFGLRRVGPGRGSRASGERGRLMGAGSLRGFDRDGCHIERARGKAKFGIGIKKLSGV
jgi:hypothetical protein